MYVANLSRNGCDKIEYYSTPAKYLLMKAKESNNRVVAIRTDIRSLQFYKDNTELYALLLHVYCVATYRYIAQKHAKAGNKYIRRYNSSLCQFVIYT